MPDLRSIPVLVPGNLNPDTVERLQTIFDVRRVADREPQSLSAADRAEIRAIAQMGSVPAELMRALPNLEIVANFGVGYDGVDADFAVSRGIMVTNTPDVLTEEVADTTLGLLLNTVREFPAAERYLRSGAWEREGPYRLTEGTLRGRKAGIMGMGRIGLAIAGRLEAFGVDVAYYNRRRRDDVPYAYHPDLLSLAAAVDTLIIAVPGGEATNKAVNAEVLSALGPQGILINIGRGSTVDEAALIEALENRTIQAAGLDVFEREPNVPERLLRVPNAVLLPHVGSASRATRREMGNVVVENLIAWFEGREPPTPVQEAVSAGIARRQG